MAISSLLTLTAPALATLQRHIIHHLHRALPPQRQNHIPQRLGHEPRLAIGKVILPLAAEQLDVGLGHAAVLGQQGGPDAGVEVGHEALVPEAECFGVVWPDVLDRFGDQTALGAVAGGVEELRYGRQVSAGEDVAADEVVGVGVGFVSLWEESQCVLEAFCPWRKGRK